MKVKNRACDGDLFVFLDKGVSQSAALVHCHDFDHMSDL